MRALLYVDHNNQVIGTITVVNGHVKATGIGRDEDTEIPDLSDPLSKPPITPKDGDAYLAAVRARMRTAYVRGVWADEFDSVVTKGGPGSGHHGHAGRPGEVGGSARSEIGWEDEPEDEPETDDRFPGIIGLRPGELLPEMRGPLYHGTSSELIDEIMQEGLIPGKGKGAKAWAKLHAPHLANADIGGRAVSVYLTPYMDDAVKFSKYAAEVSHGHGVVLKVTLPKSVLPKLRQDEMMNAFHLAFRIEGKIPPDWIEVVRKAAADDDGFVFYVVILVDGESNQQTQKGGAGSGHHGHEGRPGEVGGSQPGDGGTGAFPEDETEDDYQQELREGEITDVEELGGGISRTYRAKINGLDVKIVPDSGVVSSELRQGVRAGADNHREMAAQIINRAMDNYVPFPRTVLRELPESLGREIAGPGLVQEFVKGAIVGKVGGWGDMPADEIAKLGLFDAVIGNVDRHTGNALAELKPGGYVLTSIDHGLSFPDSNVKVEYGNRDTLESRTIDLSVAEVKRLDVLSSRRSSVDKQLSKYLNHREIDAMWTRVDKMRETHFTVAPGDDSLRGSERGHSDLPSLNKPIKLKPPTGPRSRAPSPTPDWLKPGASKEKPLFTPMSGAGSRTLIPRK